MDKKDVTPKMKKNKYGFWKKLGLGLVGGVLGGLITAGIFYVAMGSSFTTSSTSASGNQNSAGETVVENVKVNVESDITSAVDKVQGAVVSVINLQNQNQSSEFGQLFGQQEQSSSDEALEAYSEGSGVIYKKDGDSAYIVTNNHVVDGQQGLEVLLSEG